MKKKKDTIGLLTAAIKESDKNIKKSEVEVETQLKKIVEEKKLKEKWRIRSRKRKRK